MTLKPKIDLAGGIVLKSTPFIDRYVSFLEAHGQRFDDMPDYKNREYGAILDMQRSMPPIDPKELLDVLEKYISLHQWSTLTRTYFHQSPSSFYRHYFEVVDSYQFHKQEQHDDVSGIFADFQTVEQIAYLLDHLSITWGEKFPHNMRVRLVARSFAAFDKFVETEEFHILPDSIKAQFTRYQTVRNFYRHVEQNPKITDIKKSPVMSLGYLRMVVKQLLHE